jgi:tryptophan-rich sensory protein
MNRIEKQAPNLTENWRSLSLFLLICFLVFAFGGLFTPGEWYLGLEKAPWSPPNIAFPIVWACLYIGIAIAGWYVFNQGDSPTKLLWSLQLIFNSLWSWVFFGQHWVLIGLVNMIIIDMLVIRLMINTIRAQLTIVSILLVPYLIWLFLATTLNAYILIVN